MPAGVPEGSNGEDAAAATALVSLVVATLNRASELEPLVRSLIRQTDRNFELIVADQNGDDRLVAILQPARDAGIAVNHLRVPNPGAAAARNLGTAAARGPIVGFPDDDCWYDDDVVATARVAFQNSRRVQGLVGHWVDSDPQRLTPASSLSLTSWRRYKVDNAPCFVLYFRTETFRALGGFSEELGVGRYFGSAEEEDIILRMLAGGHRMDYEPGMHIHHLYRGQPPLSAQQCRRNRSYGRGMGAVLAKHRFPAWVLARGMVGPFYHAIRSPKPAAALVLGACTVLGRIEGAAGWWLWGTRA